VSAPLFGYESDPGELAEHVLCERCSPPGKPVCCEKLWFECDNFGCSGGDLHLEPGDEDAEIVCDRCEGKGGWYACTCNALGLHRGGAKP